MFVPTGHREDDLLKYKNVTLCKYSYKTSSVNLKIDAWLDTSKGSARRYTSSLLFSLFYIILPLLWGARGGIVVKALRYKPAGRGFDFWWCHWNF